ncbi:WD40-repeat-containing domain protein [Sphaerosporella brunnea]|uniref:WD40-repeat-containing domain protein n=1 Tax=Sphaerosporella brunnea TaxID=1250544 RepID=A0A5J5F4K0_9PEZI|nr:WD40-repeat-containing domain protein [Sphaerosporella brunnea]
MGQQYSPSPRLSTPRRYAQGSPDRFIPSSASPYSFHMGAPAENLSPDERLLRRHVPGSGHRDRSASPVTPERARRATAISPTNQRLSAGAVGVFGMGILPNIDPVDHLPPHTPGRQRGREINGGMFVDKKDPQQEAQKHQLRLSAALGVDTSSKVLTFISPKSPPVLPGSSGHQSPATRLWESVIGEDSQKNTPGKHRERRTVPMTPFRVLDAPGLRDDYYCSLIAYNPTRHCLAVGLNSDVYRWSETEGACAFVQWSNAHVTSLSFSSAQGKSNILAVGRISGSLTLWDPDEKVPRLEHKHASSVACLAWKPKVTYRVGGGHVPLSAMAENYGFTEDLLIVRRIVVHSQQICGLAWSPDGTMFASGGNDNVAFLFMTSDMEGPRDAAGFLKTTPQLVVHGGEKWRWEHGAAVKAIAFCPWQRTLVATGGGSNDRCIHFYHTTSGACLNTINVAAQVTSLIWSTCRREIAATLGYANPDHPIRIVVYSWPECQQVAQVPWQGEMRALFAVAYPGGPMISEGKLGAKEARVKKKRESEGCIIVATSDETVRFHEVWGEHRKMAVNGRGVLGGSDILESMEGIESDGMQIR